MIDSLHSPLLESDGYAFSTLPGGEIATDPDISPANNLIIIQKLIIVQALIPNNLVDRLEFDRNK